MRAQRVIGYWGKCPAPEVFRKFPVFARVNHFPKMSTIGRKDNLKRRLAQMARAHGKAAYGFHPGPERGGEGARFFVWRCVRGRCEKF